MKHSTFYTLLLSLLPGVGPSRYWSYVDHFGSAETALLTPTDQLPGLSATAKNTLKEFQQRGELSPLAHRGQQILEMVEKCGAQIIFHQHSDYPDLLQQIHQPPPLLFIKGNAKLLNLPQIAIVGTRHPTQTGIGNTKAFSRYLANGGFTITSGLALGIDGFAHEATLDAEGKTLAVMATGIDRVYPSRHQRLAEGILDRGGLLITEFIPGTEPRAAHFPRRNRIISGLSLGVLVIEAALRSGSLITARCALEQNREVFALPGSIHNPQAKGCHALLKEGAQLVESGEDIIKQLMGVIQYFTDQQSPTTNPPPPDTPHNLELHNAALDEKEQKVVCSLGHDTLGVEEVIERTGLSSSEVAVVLMNLEIKGIIKHTNWGYETVHEAV